MATRGLVLGGERGAVPGLCPQGRPPPSLLSVAMPPKKVVKVMNQKGQKGNKVTVFIDEKLNKKGKAVLRGVPCFRGNRRSSTRSLPPLCLWSGCGFMVWVGGIPLFNTCPTLPPGGVTEWFFQSE